MSIPRVIIVALVLIAGVPRPAGAQETMTDILSFLLTNRSVPTGDFTRDEQAAAATRDAITKFLLAELATLPFGSPAAGFTYRLSPALGASVRTTDSFGPFFTERSLTAGQFAVALGLSYSQAAFDQLDGRNLRDGGLVATAARLVNEPAPFDVETLVLRMQTRTLTLSGLVGLTDRLDVSAAIPIVTLDLQGERIDTYRGESFVQATADAFAAGIGDIVVRTKYNVFRREGGGIAIAGDIRFATGGADNLLGSTENVYTPRFIASAEFGRIGLHANAGYAFGGLARDLEFHTALTAAPSTRLTLVAEMIGRRYNAGGRLTDITSSHPTLAGVETIRLSASEEPTTRIALVGGVRWNAGGPWVVSGDLMRPITSAGLTAQWVATFTVDYSIGR